MSAAYEIPLVASPQSFQISLGGNSYTVTVKWNEKSACWVMDVRNADGGDVLLGIPFVTGNDLLEQFGHLKLGGQMIVQTDHNPDAVPTFANLGSTGHLYVIVP